MKTYAIIVGIIQHKDKLLLLKRSSSQKTSPNKWGFVSGYINERESAEEAVLRETKEETGLRGKIIKSGEPFEVSDNWGRWIIIPYLIEVASSIFTLRRGENSEAKWIPPSKIAVYDCVKNIQKDLESVGFKSQTQS